MIAHPITGAFAGRLPPREPTLGELIDAAVLASHRFRTCHCRDDCPHDAASLEAEQAVRNFMRNKLGLTHDQADALGGIL